MNGLVPLLGFIGMTITAIAVLKGIARLIASGASGEGEIPRNPVTLRTLLRLVTHLYRTEPLILFIFLLTSSGLLAKYFAGWAGLPGAFLEIINVLCVINFWIHFRTTNVGSGDN